MSRANALKTPPVVEWVVEEARNATSAEKSATSPASAPRMAAAMVEDRVDMVAAMVEDKVDLVVVDNARRLATPAAATDTCRATAPRARSATTVERSAT